MLATRTGMCFPSGSADGRNRVHEAYIRWKEKLNVDAKAEMTWRKERTDLLVWLVANVFLAAYTCCPVYVT